MAHRKIHISRKICRCASFVSDYRLKNANMQIKLFAYPSLAPKMLLFTFQMGAHTFYLFGETHRHSAAKSPVQVQESLLFPAYLKSSLKLCEISKKGLLYFFYGNMKIQLSHQYQYYFRYSPILEKNQP